MSYRRYRVSFFPFNPAISLAVHQNGAGGGSVHASQQVQHRSFPCAAGADDDAQFALFHLEIHAIQRMNSAITTGIDPGYIFEFNICHLISPSITAIYCLPHKL